MNENLQRRTTIRALPLAIAQAKFNDDTDQAHQLLQQLSALLLITDVDPWVAAQLSSS